MSKIKINILLNSFPSPSETFLFNLVTGLEKKGMSVKIIASSKSIHNDIYLKSLHLWSGNISYIPKLNKFNWIFKLNLLIVHFNIFRVLIKEFGFAKTIYYISIYDSLIKGNPDIIHIVFSGIAVNVLPILLFLKKKSKVIVSCRGTGEKVIPVINPERKNNIGKMFDMIDRIHCVSNDMLETIVNLGASREKAFINFPSIQLEYYEYSKKDIRNKDVFQIVTTGRLHYSKGFIFSLLACKKLMDNGYKFIYHILGDGPDKELIKFIIHELKLNNNVKLYGRVGSEIVKKTLFDSDIFLLSSIYEGISNAAIEAMAIGVPIISTKAGGMEEVIIDNYNGKLIDRFDQNEIYIALSNVMENYENAIHMTINARKTVELHHSIDFQIDNFINEYRALL
jgi:colanic acid/amylovoran biosynthesis glycosyltransferase